MRGPEGDPTCARPALIGLLLGTALPYFANSRAAATPTPSAPRSSRRERELEAFFHGSSDAASSITVNKAPTSLCLMALSVRALGLSSFAILLPQVLRGVDSVGVV